MSSEDIVIINDDNPNDSDIEVVDVSKETSIERKSNQENNGRREDDVIEIIDIDAARNNKDIKDYLTKVCSENKLIGQFIEKCLDIENSDGMLRVIYRTFLPLYFKMEDDYRESSDFTKVIDMTMRALEVTPHLKFTHLKFVCEMMKSKSLERKKVNFTTLSTNVSESRPRKRKRSGKRRNRNANRIKRRNRTVNIIEIDESSDEEDKRDGIPASDIQKTADVVNLEDDNQISNVSNKENRITEQSSASSVQESNTDRDTDKNLQMQMNRVSEQLLLQMQAEPCFNEADVESEKNRKIKQLEHEIKLCKDLVDKLEQEEVKFDSMDSPYIRCERLKEKIVFLYKDLCALTGDEPVKKREIHFNATDGRPQLPLKMLENFINDNIGPDGNPCLPDFFDVVDCVSKANDSAGLGWDKARIWHEARSLFTFCCKALQDSRKQREWRYIRGLATSELEDPAERDPELMARLEANRRIAVKKEMDLLEQFKLEAWHKELASRLGSGLRAYQAHRVLPFRLEASKEEFDASRFVKMEEGRCYDEPILNNIQTSQDSSDDEIEDNAFAASTSSNNGNQALSTTITNVSINGNQALPTTITNVNNCRSDIFLNSESNIRYISSANYGAYDSRFLNNQIQMAAKQFHNSFNNNTDTRMLQISIGGHQTPEIGVVTINNTENVNQKIAASSQKINDVTRMLEVCVENSKPPEIKVTNFPSDHINAENVEQDSVIDTSTCLIEFDNRPGIKIVETFEDTYKDFVQSMAVEKLKKDNNFNNSVTSKGRNIPLVIKDLYSGGGIQNRFLNNMPLVIKEVYSVATNAVDNTQSQTFSNCTSRTDSYVASKDMSILIKDVYSVASKQNNNNVQVDSSGLKNCEVIEKEGHPDKRLEVNSGEVNADKDNISSKNLVTEKDEARNKNDDATTANPNSELPNSNVEEEKPIKIKTEFENSELLKEMESFGDSFTATVFDIEDPFLVIEISDSSEESEDDLER